MDFDFNTAERSTSGTLIPAGTQAPVVVNVKAGDPGTTDDSLIRTKSGLLQLVLEMTITEGEYSRRKVWHRLTMGAALGLTLTEGQQKAVSISRTFLRSLIEAMRGISPTDDSAAAMQARKIESLMDLDGAEVWVEIGIEKDKTGEYGDKNRITKIVHANAPGPFAPKPTTKKANWA